MNAFLKIAFVAAGAAFATQAVAQVTFYEREGFQGRTFTTDRRIGDFERFGFNDGASSVVVVGNPWEVCDDTRFGGRCVVLRPGRYPSLTSMGLDYRISSVREVGAGAPEPVAAQVTFYEREGFQGRTFTTDRRVGDFERFGFNDRASSVVVVGNPWEVCDDARFGGRCVVLRPGRYPSLASMGLDNRVSSVREVSAGARIDDNRYAPAPVAGRDYRRRNDERLYEATVTSVRAVVGTPEQRCWVEREQVPQAQNDPRAIAGALISGILGHQTQAQTRDVQRCASVPSQAPAYWDVTYNFRGQEHRVQMSAPPGPTVTVNEQGEPRV